jgi:mannose-6-phosphate isomerase-like protein (cupin superfamily)
MQKLAHAGHFHRPEHDDRNHYEEHLRTGSLSVGTYSIPPDGIDDQAPHHEDEIYVVRSGLANLITPAGKVPVGAGDVLFVPAEEEHRFVDVTEDLTVMVISVPPHTGP